MSSAMSEPDICPVAGCERLVKAAGLCGTHYKQERRTGNITINVQARAAPGQSSAVQLTPLRVPAQWAATLAVEAEKRGVSVYHLRKRILEKWLLDLEKD